MSQGLLPFVSNLLGVGAVGTTPGNRGQCVGLIELWYERNGLPAVPGNAKDLLADADGKVFRATINGPVNYPAPGDVVVWGATWGSGYGHCAVVLAANSNRLVVFEQNDPEGAPCLVATHGYGGVLGWLTPLHIKLYAGA